MNSPPLLHYSAWKRSFLGGGLGGCRGERQRCCHLLAAEDLSDGRTSLAAGSAWGMDSLTETGRCSWAEGARRALLEGSLVGEGRADWPSQGQSLVCLDQSGTTGSFPSPGSALGSLLGARDTGLRSSRRAGVDPAPPQTPESSRGGSQRMPGRARRRPACRTGSTNGVAAAVCARTGAGR